MILEVKNLSFNYCTITKIKSPFFIENISFSISSPSLISIIGPNGAGKTTLFKIILGINTPYFGEIIINGLNLKKLSQKEISKKIAFVPQETNININLKVLDMVIMGRYTYQNQFSFDSSEDLKIAHESLTMVDMNDFADYPFRLLSGGEKQRVLIARALTQQAKILFLDEPTAFLDVSSQLKLYNLLMKLRDEMNVVSLIATHNLHLASSYCNECLIIKKGRLLHHDSPENLFKKEILESLFEIKFYEGFIPQK